MAQETKAALSVEQLTVVADGGYANGEHLQLCDDAGITATVPRRIIPGSGAGLYQKADFNYDGERDLYRCPAGQELRHYAQDARRKLHLYRRTGCNQCPLQSQCTPSNARSVTRHFFEAAYQRSEARLQAEPGLMRKRREHRRASVRGAEGRPGLQTLQLPRPKRRESGNVDRGTRVQPVADDATHRGTPADGVVGVNTPSRSVNAMLDLPFSHALS